VSVPTSLTLPATSARTTGPDAPTALRRVLEGDVSFPGEPGWDAARRAWNLSADLHPAAVVELAHVDDLQQLVRSAAAHDLRVALQATGHGAATLTDLDRTVLARTGRLDRVVVDPVRRRARVGAGVLARDLAAAAARHGLAFLAGSSPDVGVVGYTLGGGVGWLGRRHGLACNTVVAAEVVTASGELLAVDRDHHAELFWALRGGGGAFAAVNALELELVDVPVAHAGTLLWPIERAPEVLHTWRDWTEEVPTSVTSIGRLLRYPPVPALPPAIRGRSFVAVEATVLDPERDADAWLRPLRALRAEVDTFATVAAPDLGQLHGDPEEPVPAATGHRLLRELTVDAVDAILDLAGPQASTSLLAVDVRHLGGELGTSRPGNGVLDRLEAGYALFAVGVPPTPEVASAVERDLDALTDRMAAWDAGVAYLNFADRPVDAARLFGEDRLARLQLVKRTYDPDGRFVSNHPLPA
jgi:FAD/FMN-containing dehydrogenase